MTTANHPANQNPDALGNLAQITFTPQAKTREQIEEMLEKLEGANLPATIKTLNGLERGSYRVSITVDTEYNEIQVRLKDGPGARVAIATGYIDRGHTTESKFNAAQELRGLVRAYLCR